MKTKANPILEELWRTKDELADEAGHDLHRLCENIRQWVAANPHRGPLVKNANELRALESTDELALNEEPSEYGEARD
jgi:hypothetical protein